MGQKSRSASPSHNRSVSYLDDMHSSKGSQDFTSIPGMPAYQRAPNLRTADEPDEPYAHIHLIENLIEEEDQAKPFVMKSPLNFSAISSAQSSVNHTPQISKLSSPQPIVGPGGAPVTQN